MRVALVGAGNVATHFGRALQQAGHTVVQLYSRSAASASALGEALGVPWVTSLDRLTCDAQLYLAMLSDAALPALVPQIVRGREQALFVHTAGSLPLSVWQPYARRCGVCYPMQTFSRAKAVDFARVPLFVEGATQADEQAIARLAATLSGNVALLGSEGRRRLHLGAVFACNFANHLFAVSQQLLSRDGVPFAVMQPLIEETVAKLSQLSPVEAQTGPAVRRDADVMRSQMQLLADTPRLQKIYQLLSENIQEYDDKLRLAKN